MSPEQARGEVVDWRSDIFATGVMLFELTTGKRLFKGAGDYETLKLICDREYPTPSQVRPDYPPELEAIVMRALQKDRDKRYQSAREMQQALEDFARKERIPVSTIALNHFMQSLFEEKLAAQKEALLQGKQLADIIELQRTPDSADENNRLSQSVLSAPGASLTLTDVSPVRRSRGLVVGMVVAGLLAGIAGGAAWVLRSKGGNGRTTAAVAAVPKGSILVTSDPRGAAIWVNGDLRSEVTPATLAQLPTGRPIDVKVSKDGFERASERRERTSPTRPGMGCCPP